MTQKRKELIVTLCAGLLIVAFCYYNSADYGHSIIHRLCDGCFVTGVMFTGAGLVLHCANKGALNIFGYSFKLGLNLILPLGNNPWRATGERETYFEYCQRKEEEGPKPVSHLLISGGVYLALAGILLVVYLVI